MPKLKSGTVIPSDVEEAQIQAGIDADPIRLVGAGWRGRNTAEQKGKKKEP